MLEAGAGVAGAVLDDDGEQLDGVGERHGLQGLGRRGSGERGKSEGERGEPAQEGLDHEDVDTGRAVREANYLRESHSGR
ncbi:hypothetical protein JE024_36005 [Streptomyces zhihengii]|uniref:Uncharacterized protein n=1 Tax=Streptomyces zhihengii TaxID=1818004 RepID=A0ABS2V2C9_9ACTN|nr:hypothetical protein [Streptomyces zhihengii]